jgi:DNA polymerase-3 subunit alpha
VEKPAKAGGKFAIVTLSDPSGEYELFVNDELLQNARDILEIGERVICRVKVRRVDEELRFSMDGVKKLSQATIGSHDALYVRISADAPLEHIARVVQGLQKSPSQGMRGAIHIEIPVEGDKVVTIALDGRYPVDFGAMQAFKSVPGVNQVRPAAA